MCNIIYHTDIEQRTPGWYALKIGKFSASEIWKICAPKGFGKTGLTYINSKVAEKFTNEMPTITGKPLDWGVDYEPVAKAFYTKATKINIREVGAVENELYKNCLASPDGVNNFLEIGFEFKCPYVSANHIDYFKIKTPQDLKKIKPEYYWQVIFSMLITDFKKWIFASFDPRANRLIDKKTNEIIDRRMFTIEIPWNDSDIQFLKTRIIEAEILLKNGIDNLINFKNE